MPERKCLLIDAGATLEEPLTTLVTSFGLVTFEGDTSRETLATLGTNSEDLIVINTTAQNEQEALDLIQRIKAVSPATTLIVLTDRVPLEIEQDEPLMVYADLVLSKPCSIYQFQQAVLPVIQPKPLAYQT